MNKKSISKFDSIENYISPERSTIKKSQKPIFQEENSQRSSHRKKEPIFDSPRRSPYNSQRKSQRKPIFEKKSPSQSLHQKNQNSSINNVSFPVKNWNNNDNNNQNNQSQHNKQNRSVSYNFAPPNKTYQNEGIELIKDKYLNLNNNSVQYQNVQSRVQMVPMQQLQQQQQYYMENRQNRISPQYKHDSVNFSFQNHYQNSSINSHPLSHPPQKTMFEKIVQVPVEQFSGINQNHYQQKYPIRQNPYIQQQQQKPIHPILMSNSPSPQPQYERKNPYLIQNNPIQTQVHNQNSRLSVQRQQNPYLQTKQIHNNPIISNSPSPVSERYLNHNELQFNIHSERCQEPVINRPQTSFQSRYEPYVRQSMPQGLLMHKKQLSPQRDFGQFNKRIQEQFRKNSHDMQNPFVFSQKKRDISQFYKTNSPQHSFYGSKQHTKINSPSSQYITLQENYISPESIEPVPVQKPINYESYHRPISQQYHWRGYRPENIHEQSQKCINREWVRNNASNIPTAAPEFNNKFNPRNSRQTLSPKHRRLNMQDEGMDLWGYKYL